jgi:ATP-dependent 26S proteasome regulatory subunit
MVAIIVGLDQAMTPSEQKNCVTNPRRTELSLSLKHLQVELARIDLSIRREVRRWWLAGQDPNDDYRGMYVTRGEVEVLLEQAFGASWGQTVTLEADEAQDFTAAQTRATHQAQLLAETIIEQGYTPRLCRLADTFGLSRPELDILLICLAPAFDPRYDRLYGYLQDNVNRRRPMVRLVLDLLEHAGPERFLLSSYFDPSAPLFKYELLSHVTEPGAANPHWINQTLQPDETVVAWLMGRYHPHAIMGQQARLEWPQLTETDHLLAVNVWPRLARVLYEEPIVVFYGPDQASQQAAARQLAVEKACPLLSVDLAEVIQDGLPPLRAVRLALRDARLTGAIPYLTGWTACVSGEGRTPPPEVLTELCDHPGLVIVAGETTWQPSGPDRQRPLLWLPFPRPDYAQRCALWAHFLQTLAASPSCIIVSSSQETTQEQQSRIQNPKPALSGVEGEAELSQIDISAVAGQFILTSSQIRDAIASAVDMAFERGEAVQSQDLFAAARSHSSPRLSGLARKITSRYTWDDIILPRDQVAILRELVATVRSRPQVLEAWGVGQKLASSAGVTVLFAGPPGTGKTMSAEVIAGELGLDLYKIDLSSVVSKYIGETEKNLERIFNEATNSNAILFFDEADALFGKRSEVRDSHDRYANIEISFLLQRMETYDGVTILATNLGGNMDEAFTRRLQFVVDFPMPSAVDQQRIWETLLPASVPRQSDLDFSFLTKRFDLAGGNIRNILINATFLAAADGGQVTMAHLLHGTRRELQKMGRLVNDEELRIS